MINLQILIPLIITTIVAVVGWYIAHFLSFKRDRANKRRELRIQYLIEAYRRIERAANRPKNFDNNKELESAISDIQLFGTKKQAKLAEQFAYEIAHKSNASTDELLIDLRQDLRAELDLEQLPSEITYLRLDKG
ncbi:MAG: hypothetical protein JRE64_16175 [Deltaproteobacteria bacterium]|nr:hypothetical protein [Deltaproteobacteria bacterium]